MCGLTPQNSILVRNKQRSHGRSKKLNRTRQALGRNLRHGQASTQTRVQRRQAGLQNHALLGLPRQLLKLACPRGQFRRPLANGTLQILIQLGETLFAQPDFARHLPEAVRQFAQFVPALRQVAQHFLLKVSSLDRGSRARQLQQWIGEAAGDDRDQQDQGRQPACAD